MRAFSGGAGGLRRQLVQKRDLVNRPRVHEEENGVHRLPPPRRGGVEHPHSVIHRHRHDLVGELGEEGAEPEEERLPARRPLRADGEVALLQLGLDPPGVDVADPGQPDGGDRGEDLGESGDGVGHGRDAAAEDGREDDRVHQGPVGADEEDAGGGGRGRRGRVPPDDHAGPEERGDAGRHRHREEHADGDADGGEYDADGDPEED